MDEQFTEFAAAMWPRLVRGAVALGASAHTAEEVSQDALVSCYARWKRFGAMADRPEAYCYRAMMNKLKSQGRRKREVLVEIVPETSADADVPEGLDDGIRSLLDQLPARQRQVVVCRFVLDLSVAQTAAVLGEAEGTIKSRQSRALSALNATLTHRGSGAEAPTGWTSERAGG